MNFLSAHLYYNEPWETFLTEALAPYIETVLKTGIAESYFFIRYWDRGPHIRLRFKGEASALEEVLKPNLIEYFTTYFSEHPSPRTEPEYPLDYPEEYYWLPNNSIQFENYERELDRYGGTKGLSLSEEQFQLSSETVLNQLKKLADNPEYSEQLGVAIRLHLSFVYSLGMDRNTMTAFFNMIFENWLPRAIEVPVNEENREHILEKMNETVGQFNESFDQQSEILIAFHNDLLRDLNSKTAFEQPVFNQWVKENQRLSLQLAAAAESNQIQRASQFYVLSESLEKQLSEPQIVLWNIWADYVHMTNNRLGILNHDEAYLAYLMMRSLEGSER